MRRPVASLLFPVLAVTFALLLASLPVHAQDAYHLFVSTAGGVDEYTSGGTFVRTFVPQGSGNLQFSTSLHFGPDGNLYVGEAFGNLYVYNGTTGAFQRQVVARELLADFEFNAAGNFYHFNSNRVFYERNLQGQTVRTYNVSGVNAFGQIGLRPNGHVVLSDPDLRLRELDLASNTSSVFASGFDAAPNGVLVGEDGRVFASTGVNTGGRVNGSVWVVGANGGTVTRIGTQGDGALAMAGSALFAAYDTNPGFFGETGIAIYDSVTGQQTGKFTTPNHIYGIAARRIAAVPEPTTLVGLLTVGVLGLASLRRKRQVVVVQ